MKPTLLITGGNGFIGRTLTNKLLQEGFNVRIVTRKLPKTQPANPAVTLVQADYSDVSSLQKAMQGCVGVFHLAAAIFAFNRQGFEKANVIHTQNVVKAVNNTPEITTFIHVSSLAASGFASDVEHPRTEDMTPTPVSDYGRTKLGGENAVKTLRPGVKWTIIRPPIVYGKNDSGVSKIATWVKRGLMINTSGNGMFSFVHVDDLVEALWQAYNRPETAQETYFITEPDVYSWDYFITEMACAMHCNKPFMPSAPKWLMKATAFGYETCARLTGTQPALNYDKVTEATIPGHWICSNAKWTKLTGQKFTPLKEGLKKSF
ncbi:NAD-dependent epimerase/dehydratase family protein [Candidatus Avelusimicrobium luingense]|uniref:NAD-dependent epimerase/dehydratase family protein n=1 Tax=Candidatus Avelusimicrobium luingense TaxID=3416211 RepID=UPI003D0CAF32